jgi:hypothetical protein
MPDASSATNGLWLLAARVGHGGWKHAFTPAMSEEPRPLTIVLRIVRKTVI